LGGSFVNDQYTRSWPGQEPDEPQWPGDDQPPRQSPQSPQWPGGNERRPDPDRTQRRVPPAGRPGAPQGRPGQPPRPPGQAGPNRPARDRYRPPEPTGPEPDLLTHAEVGGGYLDEPLDGEQTRFADFAADES